MSNLYNVASTVYPLRSSFYDIDACLDACLTYMLDIDACLTSPTPLQDLEHLHPLNTYTPQSRFCNAHIAKIGFHRLCVCQ